MFNKKYKVRIAQLELENSRLRNVLSARDEQLIESHSEVTRLNLELQNINVAVLAKNEELSQAFHRIKLMETPSVIDKKPTKKITKKLKIK